MTIDLTGAEDEEEEEEEVEEGKVISPGVKLPDFDLTTLDDELGTMDISSPITQRLTIDLNERDSIEVDEHITDGALDKDRGLSLGINPNNRRFVVADQGTIIRPVDAPGLGLF